MESLMAAVVFMAIYAAVFAVFRLVGAPSTYEVWSIVLVAGVAYFMGHREGRRR